MALVINTNMQSLNAQRNLSKSLMPLQTAMQRLSSGLRINSAKDDAAGLAIAVRMSSQIRGLNQAIRNANDAVSMVQTAEGAIDEMTNALQRIRELAVQSANATNTSLDRGATDKEVQQLIQEMDRIATQTQFNNQTLLDGTLGTKTFQVGASSGQTIALSMSTGLRVTQIGQIAEATAGTAVSAVGIGVGDVTINGSSVGASVAGSANGQAASSAYAKALAINSSGITGVTATAVTGTKVSDTASAGVVLDDAGDSYSLTINTVTVASYTGITNISQTELMDRINLYSNQTGVTATLNGVDMELTAADGRNINLTAAKVDAGAADTIAFAAGTTETRGFIKLSAADNITVTDANNRLGFGASAVIAKDAGTISSVDVTTADNANDTMKRVDSALQVITTMRAELGAILNRFESTNSNLSNVLENITAAHSRIMDADFAAEAANITKSQILQQAGISVLTQANSLPQNVLSLLGGR
ncbi:MAG TPA: flagellin [Actinobacteria bacterium]|nr:flagellin [Actinomycetota bacterium]